MQLEKAKTLITSNNLSLSRIQNTPNKEMCVFFLIISFIIWWAIFHYISNMLTKIQKRDISLIPCTLINKTHSITMSSLHVCHKPSNPFVHFIHYPLITRQNLVGFHYIGANSIFFFSLLGFKIPH